MASIYIRTAFFLIMTGTALSQYVDQGPFHGMPSQNLPQPTISMQDVVHSQGPQVPYITQDPTNTLAPTPVQYQPPQQQEVPQPSPNFQQPNPASGASFNAKLFYIAPSVQPSPVPQQAPQQTYVPNYPPNQQMYTPGFMTQSSFAAPPPYGPQIYSVQSFIPGPFVPPATAFIQYQVPAPQVPYYGPPYPVPQQPQPTTPSSQVFYVPSQTAQNIFSPPMNVDPNNTAVTRAHIIPHYLVVGTPSNLFLTINSTTPVPVYSGLIIDLLNALSTVANFTYSFVLQADQQYGSPTVDGTWNGLIRTLIDGRADIAAADLSVTSNRESVVDFILPFYQYKMTMLVNRNSNGDGVSYLIRNNADVHFLKNSPSPKDKAIWQNITRDFASSIVESDNEGVQRVINGPYAFILESPGANYALNMSNSQIERSPHVFPSGHLAFAVKQGSPLREKMSWAMSKLQETGQLEVIINKYLNFTVAP